MLHETNQKVKDNESVFNDNFISSKISSQILTKLISFRYDYSPNGLKIVRIDPILKYTSILELSLIGHNLSNIDSLSSLKKLKRINLSWNNISDLTAFCNIPSLEEITLGHNFISTIPSSISLLENLKILRLNGNPLSDRNIFLRLQHNLNFINLDISETSLSRDIDPLLYCTFTLPQLQILNRNPISIEFRRMAAERYERLEILELSEQNNKLISENEQLKIKIQNLSSQTLEIPEIKKNLKKSKKHFQLKTIN